MVFCAALLILHIVKPTYLAHDALTITLSSYMLSYFIAALCAGFATRRVAYISVRPRKDESLNALMLPYGNRVGAQNVLTNLNYRGDFYMVEGLTTQPKLGGMEMPCPFPSCYGRCPKAFRLSCTAVSQARSENVRLNLRNAHFAFHYGF